MSWIWDIKTMKTKEQIEMRISRVKARLAYSKSKVGKLRPQLAELNNANIKRDRAKITTLKWVLN